MVLWEMCGTVAFNILLPALVVVFVAFISLRLGCGHVILCPVRLKCFFILNLKLTSTVTEKSH